MGNLWVIYESIVKIWTKMDQVDVQKQFDVGEFSVSVIDNWSFLA